MLQPNCTTGRALSPASTIRAEPATACCVFLFALRCVLRCPPCALDPVRSRGSSAGFTPDRRQHGHPGEDHPRPAIEPTRPQRPSQLAGRGLGCGSERPESLVRCQARADAGGQPLSCPTGPPSPSGRRVEDRAQASRAGSSRRVVVARSRCGVEASATNWASSRASAGPRARTRRRRARTVRKLRRTPGRGATGSTTAHIVIRSVSMPWRCARSRLGPHLQRDPEDLGGGCFAAAGEASAATRRAASGVTASGRALAVCDRLILLVRRAPAERTG